MLRLSFFFFFYLFILIAACAQENLKYEREYRIRKDTIAENACVFIHQSGIVNPSTRVKWYREEQLSEVNVEAKFKQGGYKYSIEFSEKGALEDAEIEIPAEEIPKEVLKSIKESLETEFKSWKIKKVQWQWLGSEAETIESLKKNSPVQGIKENYEVVVKGETEEVKSYFELLFSKDGSLIRQSRIVENPSDILIY